MARRKFLIIASWYPNASSPVGGIFVQDQAQALAKKYDVAVIAPRVVGWREILQKKFGAISQLATEGELLVSRERVIAPIPRALALMYRRWLLAAEKSFRELLARWGKPDLIHAHVVLPGGLAAVRLGRQYKIPVVLTEHSSPFSMHLKNAALRRWVKETLAHADHVIAVSPALAQQIQAFDKDIAIRIAGNLIDTDFFSPAPTERHNLTTTQFLTIGLLTEQKGITFLLQAAALLVQRGIAEFTLTIGGGGPQRPQLERLTQSLGLAEHCRFTGMLARAEVKRQMQHCDVFILPSLHETFGLVLAEAMACGKPVIATRCGGPEFVVTPETGILVDAANPEALANAMADFITRRLQYDSQRVRNSVVARFGEAAFLKNVAALYEEVWAQSDFKT